MNKDKVFDRKPCVRLGELLEAQFDRMNRDLAHMTPRNIKEYNTLVGMVKMQHQGGHK